MPNTKPTFPLFPPDYVAIKWKSAVWEVLDNGRLGKPTAVDPVDLAETPAAVIELLGSKMNMPRNEPGPLPSVTKPEWAAALIEQANAELALYYHMLKEDYSVILGSNWTRPVIAPAAVEMDEFGNPVIN